MQSPDPAMSLEGHASCPPKSHSLSPGQVSSVLASTLLPSGPGQGVEIRASELSTTFKRVAKEEVTLKERTPKSWQKDTKGGHEQESREN